MSTTISTTELQRRRTDPDVTVVDLRPIAAYNGWSLQGEPRGGHIPGAVAFPGEWLRQRRCRRDRPAAGRQGRHARPDGRPLRRPGRGHAALVTGSRTTATRTSLSTTGGSRPGRPTRRCRSIACRTTTAWSHRVARAAPRWRPVEAAPAGKYLLFHVNFGVPEEYADGHIPGALYLDTNWLEDPADWNRRSPEALETALRALGITNDTTVIVYGRDTEGDANEKWPGRRAGQIAATRALMILRYAGVDDVRLLDGGYDWWVRGGRPVETEDRPATPVPAFGVQIPLRPEVIVDIEEAKEILADPDGAALVSVRTWREHIGNVSGYNYIGPAGRIAGDVWGNCGTDAYHMQHYRNVDNTMRAYPEIAANWDEAGITPDKWVAFYCGTGWRASETWFYAYLQGWERIAVYDGGWFEWSQDPENNPIEIGEPEDVVAA